MAWTPFSAEAVVLHSQIIKLTKEGRISHALDVINAALEKAHRDGPSNMTYEEFEARADAASKAAEKSGHPTNR